ncbi:MAG: DHA2 family efflux MFS transporter permease subunit [Candidatus Dormibacteraeota bacterium]|uniref:DHA2 family efflux MFS transporter permease subunit n=1 Tax=Candidatus Amunia macphersoniae TaxID=3127014 RepID=A0A934KPX8_9BACT|nr:DHA2 family efflux MFS transporter permease subunit [Candidatus Dormibacteraeota bacterium]
MSRIRPTAEQVVAIIYVTAMFMSIMDTTIVNVGLPAFARDFHVSPPATDGVVVGYLVSLAVWIPASGWIGDRYGTKRTFLFALGLFTAASIACGLSQSVLQLVISRVIQGIGGGMLTPTGTAMLFRAFPPARRARAARILVIPTVMAPALGPVIGGALVDNLSWRWVFFVNVPIGMAAFGFGLLALTEHRERAREPFDVFGFLLAGSGFGLLLFALSEAAADGWTSLLVVATGASGVALVVTLVAVELRRSAPMIDFRILRHRLFGVINLASLFAASGFIGLLFITTIYLQAARGFSALAAGSSTAPEAIGVLVASQLVGRIYPRIGPRRLMVSGMALVAAATVLLSAVMTGDLWVFRAVMFLIGIGWAFVVIPMNAGAFAEISPRDTGRASALYNAQRQLAAALGVATLATIVGSQLNSGAITGNVGVFREAFLVAAAFALAGAVVALGIRDSDAASTMRLARPEPTPVSVA